MASNDDWIAAQEDLERVSYDVMQKINAMNEAPKHGIQHSRLNTQIVSLRKTFDEKLEVLQQRLVQASKSFTITRAEADRRQRLVDSLRSKSRQMDMSINDPNKVGRSALFGQNSRGGGSGWNDDLEASPVSSGMSANDHRQQHMQLIREQDQGLEALDEIIIRQKNMARDIGIEIETQNEVIDDITEGMDHTNERLIRNTRNIKKVGKKSGTCGYWIVIILLFIIIIVLASW
jgi:hypothetical protein